MKNPRTPKIQMKRAFSPFLLNCGRKYDCSRLPGWRRTSTRSSSSCSSPVCGYLFAGKVKCFCDIQMTSIDMNGEEFRGLNRRKMTHLLVLHLLLLQVFKGGITRRRNLRFMELLQSLGEDLRVSRIIPSFVVVVLSKELKCEICRGSFYSHRNMRMG